MGDNKRNDDVDKEVPPLSHQFGISSGCGREADPLSSPLYAVPRTNFKDAAYQSLSFSPALLLSPSPSSSSAPLKLSMYATWLRAFGY